MSLIASLESAQLFLTNGSRFWIICRHCSCFKPFSDFLRRWGIMIHQLKKIFPAICQSSSLQHGKGYDTVAASKWLELAATLSPGYGDFLLELRTNTESLKIFNTQLLQNQSYHRSETILQSCSDSSEVKNLKAYLNNVNLAKSFFFLNLFNVQKSIYMVD